ncbi:MAG: glycosyltransferase family 4 protein [Gemmatimonadota bacterium]|nr:glycosyltransferase family 4 protein [Gemmatimonadota bacterium]
MNHLLLTYDFPPIGGGIARMMGELAKRYPAGALTVSTGSHPRSWEVDRAFPNRIDRVPTPSGRLRTVQGLLAWTRRAGTLAHSLGPRFIWCGNLKPAGYPANWIHRRAGTPYGVMLYGTELLLLRQRIGRSALKRRTARALLGSASVLLTISRATEDLCRQVLSELGFDRRGMDVRVVPLGTDPEHFRPGVDPAVVRSRYRLEGGRWLLTVARLAAHKGIDTGLLVLAMLRDEYPDLRYAVVGSGIKQHELEALAGKLGVAGRVRFLTGVPDEDLPGLYNHAELYLGVSRPAELMIEGFGISLSEASACGLPVVGGLSGGIPDAVRDGETGLLVDAGRAEAVVDAVRLLLRDRELARRLGRAGRKAVEQFYNWDRVTADVVRIGEECAAGSLGRRVLR